MWYSRDANVSVDWAMIGADVLADAARQRSVAIADENVVDAESVLKGFNESVFGVAKAEAGRGKSVGVVGRPIATEDRAIRGAC